MLTFRYAVQVLAAALATLTLVLGAATVVAAEGQFQDLETTPYGTFNGVDYVRHIGRLVGTAAGGSYSAPFEIVVAADPSKGNGRTIVEPFHSMGGAAGRNNWLTPEFLFGRGFSHAAVCIGKPSSLARPGHPCTDFEGVEGDASEIIAHFGRALRADPTAPGLVGGIEKLYGLGIAANVDPIDALLYAPLGEGLFDFTLLMQVSWPSQELRELPDTDAGRVIAFIPEADIQNLNAAAFRGSGPMYRSYEMSGAPHIPDLPATRMRFPGPPQSPLPPIAGSTPLDWTPVVRALFIAGDRWAIEGQEPPGSIVLTGDSSAADGIARDENGNALGGIRLPDLGIGRGKYIAVSFALPDEAFPKGWPMFGGFEDLKCAPRADGSVRFEDHAAYVRRFTEVAQELVADGYLLREDADGMVAKAEASDIGKPEACVSAPALLPETGRETNSGLRVLVAVLAGLVSVGAGLGLRRRAAALR
jgi:hypothetical protein